MGMRGLLLGLVMASCAAQLSHAALVVPVQQTLSRSSFAGQRALRLEDSPPDVLVGNVYGVQTASTKSEHLNYPISTPGYEGQTRHVFATASMTTTVREDRIGVTAATDAADHWEWFGDNNTGAYVDATITFDVTQSATFDLALNTRWFIVSGVTLTGPIGKVFGGSETGWAFFDIGYRPVQGILTLDPGRYVLQIGSNSMSHMTASGAGTMDFSMVAVPEPGAVGMMVMTGVGLLGMRRRQGV